MIVEGNGRFFLGGKLRGCFQHGAKAGAYGADRGQNTQDPKEDQNPDSQTESVLQPGSQPEEKQGGEDDGYAELAYPHQKIQQFHGTSCVNGLILL